MQQGLLVNPNYESVWRHTRRIVTPKKAVGTGCLVRSTSARGGSVLLVTNAHVVDGFARVSCEDLTGPNSILRDADLVAIDYTHDLAVLQIKWEPNDAVPQGLELGESPRLGDVVCLCGFPAGSSSPRLYQGLVSGLQDLPIEGHNVASLVVQAPVNEGSSGGPVCSPSGRLVGIVWAMNRRLRRNVQKPSSPSARAAISYMEQAMNPVDGFGFVLDPSDIEAMLASHKMVESLGDNKSIYPPVEIQFPRSAFVQLQRQVAGLNSKDLPPQTSCIGPFNITPDRASLLLGFHGSLQRELSVPKAWFKVLSENVPQFHFYLRGYTIVAYHKGPGYSRGIWVDRVQLALTK